MLLGESTHPRREILVAVTTADSTIAGVLSFQRLPRALSALRLRVVQGQRRRGIGSALLRAVLDGARHDRIAAVFGKVSSVDDPGAAAFLVRHGFAHLTRIVTMEAEVAVLRASLRQLRLRVTARRSVPEGMQIVPFADAPRDEVARLFVEHVAHDPELAARLQRRFSHDARLAASPVAMVGTEIAGFLLWSQDGTTGHVLARVVAPRYRGGWVNVVLLEEAMALGGAAGLTRTRFEALTTNRDTLKLAQRFGAEPTMTNDVYRLDLPAARE
jgi:GNAT superfamily N-acetyltransferase